MLGIGGAGYLRKVQPRRANQPFPVEAVVIIVPIRKLRKGRNERSDVTCVPRLVIVGELRPCVVRESGYIVPSRR